MAPASIHYELLLPNPVTGPNPKRPELLPLTVSTTATSWLEVQRFLDARIYYRLGGGSEDAVGLAFEALRTAIPGLALGRKVGCAVWGLRGPSRCWLRAVPLISDRLSSVLQYKAAFDAGSLLLRQLSSGRLAGADVVVQYLFRPTFRWEMGRFARPWWGFGKDRANPRGVLLTNRAWDFPYHVEIRVAAACVSVEELADVLGPWFAGWTSTMGKVWWTLHRARRGREAELQRALFAHDIFACASSRRSRDLSAGELTAVLPFPWKERHPNVRYVGAPEGRAPVELVAGSVQGEDLILGRVGNDRVRLPDTWHHLAVVGKTGAGKSTLVQSVVRQILRNEPLARVIVLEPTGTLIEGIVRQLPEAVAADTIEIDPSRSSFVKDGVEHVAVPLNLLCRPDQSRLDGPEREGRAERIVGGLVQSIKNAWGPESFGGRADYVVRSFVQALLPIDGTNLVDVHAALTDKAALTRLERLGLIGTETLPLPKLGVEITISSIDKVGKIAGSAILRKTLCQRYGTVPFGDLLQHRLLLLNLRDGAVGTEGANFLGAILLTQLWSALQERASGDPGADARLAPPPVYLVVDEFQHYAIKAFAAMLSEGRRLGLRVIAATQTLEGIPESLQPALIGNVDAWVMFPLGANDQRLGWNIVQGKRFEWTPDDLAEGPLGPYQAAYFASGNLLKLTTDPIDDPGGTRRLTAAPPRGSVPPVAAPTRFVSTPPLLAHLPRNEFHRRLPGELFTGIVRTERASVAPPGPPAKVYDPRATVDRSTRRYARREDSRVSPLSVGQHQRLRLIEALSPDEGTAVEDLVKGLSWDEPTIHATIALSRVTGDVARDADGRVRLLPRGQFYREAVRAARNEGEEHCGLLADVAAFLDGLRIPVEIVVQGNGYLQPDAAFTRNGRNYHIEVECSTLERHPDQVVRNTRKAIGGGGRCLFAVADRASADSLAALLTDKVPEVSLWQSAGILWRDGPAKMTPLQGRERRPWGLLSGEGESEPPAELARRPEATTATEVVAPSPLLLDLPRVIGLATRLREKGLEWASATDFDDLARSDGTGGVDAQRLGQVLAGLALPTRRVRVGDRQARVYDLQALIATPPPGRDRDPESPW